MITVTASLQKESVNLFKKPSVLCQTITETLTVVDEESQQVFSDNQKKLIKLKLRKHGLIIRKARLADVGAVKKMLDEIYTSNHRHYREYSLYETIRFGTASVIMLNSSNKAVGVSLSAGYGDKEKTLFTSFTAVLKAYNGHNFGVDLSTYSSLMGMDAGRKIKRCTANPNNIATLINLLNYVGYIIDGFHRDLYVKGLHQYSLSLPLTPSGLFNNAINLTKVDDFMNTKIVNEDYKILDCSDLESIEAMYKTTDFMIVAILPKKFTKTKHQFLAVPRQALDTIY